MAQQQVPLTPEQELKAALFLRRMGYFEACIMPWVMLAVFAFAGLATFVPRPPYLVFEDAFFLASAIGSMLVMYTSGVAVLVMAQKTETAARAKLPQVTAAQTGPILSKAKA